MREFLECIGIVLILLALFFGFRGCLTGDPLIGKNGMIYDTSTESNIETEGAINDSNM